MRSDKTKSGITADVGGLRSLRASPMSAATAPREQRAFATPLLFAILLLSGCSNHEAMFPLDSGNKWTYSYRAGFKEGVEPIEISRQVSVAGVQGVELSGPMGISQVAWKNGELVATTLPNLGLMPPLPLLVGGQKKAQRKWEGWLIQAGEKLPAKATLLQEPEAKTVGSRKYETVKCTLHIQTPDQDKPIELLTWYVEGIGMVRQEQRIGGELLIALEYLSGP